MKTIKNQSVATSMKLNETEKDMLKRLMEDDHTEQCIIAYFLTVLSHKSENIRIIASQWDIKSSWANSVYEIGKKLWFRDIRKVRYMKRDRPVRLDVAL